MTAKERADEFARKYAWYIITFVFGAAVAWTRLEGQVAAKADKAYVDQQVTAVISKMDTLGFLMREQNRTIAELDTSIRRQNRIYCRKNPGDSAC